MFVRGLMVFLLTTLALEAPPRTEALYINPAVLRLPGITRAYIDSLVSIVGPLEAIDTLPTVNQGAVHVETDSTGFVRTLNMDITCGWFRDDTVFLNPHLSSYNSMAGLSAATLQHPPGVTTPAGVIAHEFGHKLLSQFRQIGVVPPWALGNPEFFADRFALVVLALRDEAPRMSSDTALVHFVVSQLEHR